MKKRTSTREQRPRTAKPPKRPAISETPQAVREPATEKTPESRRVGMWFHVVGLILAILLGLWVRLEDLRHWYAEPHKAFYQGQPLLTALDGNFYLSLARDLMEGTYSSVDELRAVPDYPKRPQPPPLISVMAAGIAGLTSVSLNWVAILLPVVLGMLIMVPVYALGRHFGGACCGTLAALLSVIFPYYVYRSGVGWFDTDSLNVTLATFCALFFLKFAVTDTSRRHGFLLAGMLTYLVFLWWWDQTPEAVTVVSLLPFLVAIVFFYRPKGLERRLFYGALTTLVVFLALWKGSSLVTQFTHMIRAQLGYIAKESAGPFPNIGLSISEQIKPSLLSVMGLATGNILTFVFAFSGFLWLIYRNPKQSLFLVSLFILSALAFLYARRFAIFCTPLGALGFSFGACELWKFRTRLRVLTFVIPPACAFLIWTLLEINRYQIYWPKEKPSVIAGMDLASRVTPPNSVIWAWWDHGYGINYWARRTSVNDGSVHTGERTVYNAIPFATPSERLAANLIHFYVARGSSGTEKVYRALDDAHRGFVLLRQVLEAGPEGARAILRESPLVGGRDGQTEDEWLDFFFPPHPRPVYLLVDELLARTSYWWFWFGTWDISKHDGIHTDYRMFDNLVEEANRIRGPGGLDIDLRSGVAKVGNQTVPLREYGRWNAQESRTKSFNRETGPLFEMSVTERFGAIMLPDVSTSVFNRLFLRRTYSSEYFHPVSLQAPFYQLWEVRGDSRKEGP